MSKMGAVKVAILLLGLGTLSLAKEHYDILSVVAEPHENDGENKLKLTRLDYTIVEQKQRIERDVNEPGAGDVIRNVNSESEDGLGNVSVKEKLVAEDPRLGSTDTEREEELAMTDSAGAIDDTGIEATNVTRVSMCCGKDQLFNMEFMLCEDVDHEVVPVFHDQNGAPVTGVVYQVEEGFPNCSFYTLSPSTSGLESDYFRLAMDGDLVLGRSEVNSDYPPYRVPGDQYCLLYPEPEVMDALICFPELEPMAPVEAHRHKIQQLVYPACLLVSSMFLFLTLVVYCLVRELREDLLGKCFMCSIAMLGLAQLLMVVGKWAVDDLIMTRGCVALASLTHFCFLSAFLWLNVISCIVFWSFWSSGMPRISNSRVSPFFWCCCYGWGLAAVVAGGALLRDVCPPLQGTVIPAPKFGAVGCWFSNSPALVLYLLGPISLLLLINIVCFCLAAYKMTRLQKTSSRTSVHYCQYLKLFVLMGVSWVFEVISFFVDAATGDHPLTYIWIFFDMLNITQGLLIFLLFVCRAKVLRHLVSKLCPASCWATCLGPDPEEGEKEGEAVACSTVV